MTLRIVLAGGSGFLGQHLRDALTGRGHTVTSLVRRTPQGPRESAWDPYAGTLDTALVADAHVVVNLAGSPLVGNPWSQRWRRSVRESRVTTTQVLATAIAAADAPPAFLAGNGISYYGDHGAAELTEVSDSRGHGLLTDVSREWEAAAAPARQAGARTCVLRTAPVMDADAPPLKMLRPIFRAGLGGKLGNGRQHMAMISLRDWVGAVVHLAEHTEAAGAFNLCCEQTPTNAEFTAALGRAVHRPTVARVPGVLLGAAGRDLGDLLLDSVNARPAALLAAGYTFADPDVEAVLASGLARLR